MKKFINPEFELIELEKNDVIVTSGLITLSDKQETDAAPESPAKSQNWTALSWNTNQ